MASWKVLALTTFVFSIFCFLSAEKQPDTLNVLSILLPYSTAGSANVNFTIWASDGCYKWSSSRSEIANVRPVQKPSNQGDVCSQEAVVTSQSSKPEKQTAIIIAEEKVTGNVLRADVFVNRISRIEITTTTRELLLGQSPELLDVIAFDNTGNLFSSFDGLVFDWELITVTGSIEASSVLRIVPFAESINETSVAIYALEAKGLRGNSIIVEGINTGTAIVKAKLSHPTFKDVEAHSVKLLVIDNLMIVPSMDVYIMINTVVKYHVKRFRQNSVIDIQMPSGQFKFVVSNTTVGTMDEPSSQVIGRALGYTQVTLIDNNMKDQSSTRQPSAGIHVVQPDHLGFSISPGGEWVLQTNRQYIITVDVYDKLNHKLYVAENIVINTIFPETYFTVSQSSINGSYHVTRTLKSGKTLLHAVLDTVKLITTGEVVTLNPPVEGQREVVIYEPISVMPAILVFPWIPVSGEYYRFQLKAAGGSGHYSWTSDVTSIASVNTRGLLTTSTETGMTEVKAHDLSNSMHFGVAQRAVN